MNETIFDAQRQRMGLMTLREIETLIEQGNSIFDPFSTLISCTTKVGTGNIFYPSVIIQTRDEGSISIGSQNIFYPNTLLLAEAGMIVVGSGNQFGDGGVSLKAQGSSITVQDRGRYMNSPQILGETFLGTGSQVLGRINVQHCRLEAGEDYTHPDPDLRAGVLKGSGVARQLLVKAGEVINGNGVFEQANIERQTFYHPKK